MSGYPPNSAEGNGLDSLFAQLRQAQNKPTGINLEPSYSYYNGNGSGYFGQPTQPQQLPHGYHQPSVSSPIPTPPTHVQQPQHSSAIMSPVDTPPRIPIATGGTSNAARTSSLLNLLKFSQPSAPAAPAAASPTQSAPIGTPLPHSREVSMNFKVPEPVIQAPAGHSRDSSDLLATLMSSSKPTQQASPQYTSTNQPPKSTFSDGTTSPPDHTQAYLLSLLNKPKPPQNGDVDPHLRQAKVPTPPSKFSSRDDVADLAAAFEVTNLDVMKSAVTEATSETALTKENVKAEQSKNSQGLFTYVNPFEQLAASSPRNRTPKASTPVPSTPAIQILKRDHSDNKRKMDERSTISSPAHSKRKLDPQSHGSSGPPTPLPDGRTQLEALIGIGAPGNRGTVAEALNEVGDQVDKQVQEAIARAERDENQATIERDLKDMLDAQTDKEFEASAQIAATSIRKELEKDANSGVLDDLPTPVADAVKDIIGQTAQGNIVDSWESADAEDNAAKEEEEEGIVKVYNFPMKPWTSITLRDSLEPRPVFRDEVIMDIARVRKDFDQIDRTLVTASDKFIVYGMSKAGGIRIIRQADGKEGRLFNQTQDRIFNVSASFSPAGLKEAIIGTGISGTVYWGLVKDGEEDNLEDANLESHGFALPPMSSVDTESPGGVLKTRARKSSRHPDFFAVGRGKFIHIIWPHIIMTKPYLKNGKERVVDAEKYLARHSLKVNIGKAGKDFTFSEDDTTIVSLDKAGRVKFWDVRPLTLTDGHDEPRKSSAEEIQSIEIKEPVVTYTTTPATEKSWPTSVLFVDKLRPYQKGGPLRYLIVGMKQNHTLQLWDLALGKPVQEINLPHEKESDAVCSVMYHAATGMVVVGHPTRNSIYFLHLSAPKYTLSKSISQAEYMERLVSQDPTIPKPESTAVISGMREYSFESKGTLRSLDILQTPATQSLPNEPLTMFELYAMHSKGVTCLAIKQADLGWTTDNKVIQPVVAENAGIISIDSLKETTATPNPELSDSQTSIPTRIIPRPSPKENLSKESPKKAAQADLMIKVEEKSEKKEPVLSNGGFSTNAADKSEKKKRRKATTSDNSVPAGSSSQASKNTSLEVAASSKSTNTARTVSNTEVGGDVGLSRDLINSSIQDIEGRVSGELKKLFSESFQSLHQNIKEDRRTQAAVADAKQDSILRLVSSTLTENVETSLSRIIVNNVQKSVLPAISELSMKTVKEQLGPKLNAHISQSLPKELHVALPDALGKALQQPQLLKLMSEALATSVAFRVEEQLSEALQEHVTPAFTAAAIQAAQRAAGDVYRQATEQISTLERQRVTDSIKIDRLTQLVTGLTETVSSMAAAQTEFQGHFLKLQHQASRERQDRSAHNESRNSVSNPSTALTVTSEKSPEEVEYEKMLDSITSAMNAGRYEDAIIRWLQTKREQEFFQRYFAKFNPEFIRELSPLLLLSLGATITIQFDDDLLMPRISWLETILSTFQGQVNAGALVSIFLLHPETQLTAFQDDQVRELIPKIMGIYVQRIEHLFMRISNISAQDPTLKRLSQMVNAANRILDTGNQISRGLTGSSLSRDRHI
ncbi:hypothetical protein B7494_g8313 [Chlorociboria aeruginascens]|nr:hypothetical protein B7494_g8313 [Chlorociboria aeruginascens]